MGDKEEDEEVREAVAKTADKSFATAFDERKNDGGDAEKLASPMAEGVKKAEPFKSAKESFDSFQEPEKPSDVAKKMLELAKTSPQAGAVAKLYNDEVNAIGGYDAYMPLFGGDYEAQEAFRHIIRDEESHKRILQRLFDRIALGSKEPLIDPKDESR